MSENEGISLIQQWLQKAIQGNVNEDILFIDNNIQPLISNIDIIRSKYKNAKFNIYLIDDSIRSNIPTNPLSLEKNNIILKGMVSNINESFQKFLRQTYGKKILYFKTSLPLEQIVEKINSGVYNDIAFNVNKIEPISLEYLLKNHRSINVEDFLLKELTNRQNILSLNKLAEMGMTINELTWLQYDIGILQKCNVLTSRLAVILYRFTFLDLNANYTLIGRYIHQICGVRSKTMNSKYSSLTNCLLPEDLKQKNFKAYDLSVNESDIAIREEIATKLLNLQIKQLDIKKIAMVTSLTIEKIEKLKKKM
jgi:hypothetical protein